MIQPIDGDLGDGYQAWTDEQLIRAATQERSEYRPEAIIMMFDELRRRGLSPSRVDDLSASLPARPLKKIDGTKQTANALARSFRNKIVGTVAFVSGLAGVALAQWGTERATHSESYYSQHPVAGLLGAFAAFGFSFLAVKASAAVIRWSYRGEEGAAVAKAAGTSDREMLGYVYFAPYLIFAIAVAGVVFGF